MAFQEKLLGGQAIKESHTIDENLHLLVKHIALERSLPYKV